MRNVVRGLLALVALVLVAQIVPYGRDRANPKVVAEPRWDSPRTRELFFRACKDCHSNETEWPWYSVVAPVSWLVHNDVNEGRRHFDVSEWGRKKNHGDEAAKMVRENEMPLWFYVPLHPEARLTNAERKELVAGLVATFGDEEAPKGSPQRKPATGP